ncbi:MAG: DUF5702 domain-containing protein [Clostridiaceae bacterium]
MRRDSGQITVFAAIILPAVLILAGILVDISRINAGRAIVQRAADTAAKSLLAGYGSRLKEDYGIFAIPSADNADLQDRYEEYLAGSLSIPSGEDYYKGSTDLFGFRIEKISITPIYNLSENNVTKKQILEYMKYRAPEALVEGFMERLSAVKDVGIMSQAYKKKVGVDKLLDSMDKSQQSLKKNVDGSGKTGDKYINGFNLGGTWEAAFNSFNTLSQDLASIKSRLDSLDGSIAETEAPKQQMGKDMGSVEKDAEEKLRRLGRERSDLAQSYSDTGSRLDQLWDEIRNSMTSDYIKANENAAKEIEKIAEKGRKTQEAIANLEKYLGDNFNSGDGTFSRDFKEQTQKELEELKKLILDGRRAEDMLNDVGANSLLLKSIIQKLDEAAMSQSGNVSSAGLPSEILDMARTYSAILYDYSKPEKGNKTDDPRSGKADAVKEFISEKILKDVNYKTEGIDEKDLPSHTKVKTESFDREDANFIPERYSEGGIAGGNPSEAVYGGNLQNIGDEADFYDEEGMFQENALGFISEIGRIAAGEASTLRDNIYLNEYIMGTFKNTVPAVIKGMESVKDTNLHGIEKDRLQTFYDSEVEYVLHGNASQKLNNIMTKSELLLVRFGLNTLHVYTDGRKKAMATGIATAVAGWWTGGAGIPVISNLIMCGWGMGEAVADVMDLMEGKSVPIYKLPGDWKLEMGLPAVAGPKTDKRLYFNYHDYLRLFLLTMDENKKLDRVEDLIQLNMGKLKEGFRMSGFNTFVRVEAEVSMKYLFITQPFVQRKMKTKDGRYVFKVLVYEGY